MTSSIFARQIILGLAVTVAFMLGATPAQSQATNQYDKGTPPQFAAGVSSFGSYNSADLGTVNLSNGALNLKIPLVNIGGRGMSVPITLNWSSKIWSASIDYDQERGCGRGGCDDPNPSMVPLAYADYASADSFVGYEWRAEAGWTVGGMPFMNQRIVRVNYTDIQPRGPCYDFTLPKLTFMMPDRGEIEFRDDVYDGAPLPSDCGGYTSSFSRGRRWHATDGSGAIYISDVDNGASWRFPNLTGVVITADGTRFYLNAGGGCHTIVDRNGNKITLTQNGIVDPLGRTTTIQNSVPDPDNPSQTLAVLVTVTGYGGQPRYYKVKSGTMSEHYRSDINPSLPVITGSYDPMSWGYSNWWPTTATKLFSLSYGLFVQRIDDRPVIYELVLPDQRSLRFNYNEFGEVAEVQMPTGGKVWYDYAPRNSLPSGSSEPWEYTGEYHTSVWQVDRAVIRRRTFPDGSTLEGTWNYGYSNASALVSALAPDGTLLLNQAHLFLPSGRYMDSPYGGAAHTGTNYTLWSTGIEWRTETRDANGVMLAATEKDWTQRVPVSWPVYQQEQPANDNRVNQARRYLDDGSIARTDTVYDNFNYPRANNVAEVWEYDFDQSLKRRTTTAYVTGAYQNDDSIHLLSLPLTQTVLDENGNQVAQTTHEYDNYAGDGNHAPLADYGAVVGHDNSYNAGRVTRGNLTATGRWLNTTNSNIYSYFHYDILGNAVGTKDGRGNITTISFADDFGDGSNPGGGVQGSFGATYALPTLVTSPPPKPGQQPHTARSQYDFVTGLLTGFRDRNGFVTQTIYNDPFNRPTLIKSALGVNGVESRTSLYYAPATTPYNIILANNDVLTAKDQNTVGDGVLRSWTRTDGYGRTVESWSRDPQGDVKVHTIFDGLGRPKQASNPYRPSLGETPVYTTTGFDLAGRTTSVTTPDNAVVATAYSGNRVLMTDPAGKQRINQSNALGQIKNVWEVIAPDAATEAVSFPNHPEVTAGYRTTYNYDVLDNLITVYQATQTRTFGYDSLKRLTSSSNPESGMVTYSYDENNNLRFKTDARGIVTDLRYDTLNRLTTKLYRVNGQPDPNTGDVEYLYDNATNGKGRLWLTLTSGSHPFQSAVGEYDAVGNVKQVYRLFGNGQGGWHPAYGIGATYDLAGHLKTMTYPSNRTVTNTFDDAGRLSSFTGYLGDGALRTYTTGISYSSFGTPAQEQFGTATALYHKRHYNVRGQLYDVRVSTLAWAQNEFDWNRGAVVLYYGGAGWGQSSPTNNGNVTAQQHWAPLNEATSNYSYTQQSYAYDPLNRLTSVSELHGWPGGQSGTDYVQAYDYDRFGNRRISLGGTTGSNINNLQTWIDPNNNRLYAASDQNISDPEQRLIRYDADGNQKADYYGPNWTGTRTYDAENRMKSATTTTNNTSTYAYDGDGNRVKRIVNATETWQVYGLSGELLAEYAPVGSPSSPQKEYGYRNDELLVTAVVSSGWGAPPTFADNPLNPPGQPKTGVKAIHLTQLRAAINLVRAHYNLPNYQWQKPTASGGAIDNTVSISWEPIDEMRTVLDQALGPPSNGYTAGLAFNQPILAAHIQEIRDRVVAAWQSGGGGTDLRWLVSDPLGTPRMVFDQSGSLATVSRHDYLPFGEEISANVGGRTSAQGYAVSDGLRQKFTSKERDDETGLDYFLARYYSSLHGRFTSVDPSRKSIVIANPQSWNRYSYTLNNPLALVDENGKWPEGTHDRIIDRAFNTMEASMKRAIQRGSARVDFDRGNPKTLWEKNAYQHGMTPGKWVRERGVDQARADAREAANDFIQTNLNGAKGLYQQASRTRTGLEESFLSFGAATHTIMDSVSPAHRDFKIYDTSPYWTIAGISPAAGVVAFGVDMYFHGEEESREPTTDEMNEMVDDIRMRFSQVYGEDVYNRAVSQEEREATQRRVAARRQNRP